MRVGQSQVLGLELDPLTYGHRLIQVQAVCQGVHPPHAPFPSLILELQSDDPPRGLERTFLFFSFWYP